MGKISRIQLRGISRTPSDRMSEDGGCAESLNVSLDHSELAPSFIPEDVTKELGLPDDLQAEKVFVHKGNSFEHIIAVTEQEILAYIDGVRFLLYYLTEEEAVTDIATVGNTVIVSTMQGPLYFLLKEKRYHLLGRQIPFPTIEFYDAQVKAIKKDRVVCNQIAADLKYAYAQGIYDENGAEAIDAYMEFLATSDFDSIYYATHFREEFWNDVDINNKHKKELASSLFGSVKGKWQEMIAKNAEKGIFNKSFWAVYGLSLYDGSLLISTPQLVSPGDASIIDVCAKAKWFGFDDDAYNGSVSFLIRLNTYFRLGIKLHDFRNDEIEPWKDIIKSVDVYISEDINSADYVSMTLKEAATKIDDDTYLARFSLNKSYEESYITAALSRSQFVKVEEFSISESEDAGSIRTIADLRSGFICDSKKYVLNTDRFSGKDLLSSLQYDVKQSLYVSDKVLTYNQYLYLLGVKEILSTGTKWFNAQRFNFYLPVPLFAEIPNYSDYPKGWFENPWKAANDNGVLEPSQQFDMKISYYVSNPNGSAVVYGRSAEGRDRFSADNLRYTTGRPSVGSLIIYPNPNCKYAEIEIRENGLTYKKKVEMTPHPFFPMCSYWYGGNKDLNVALANGNDFDSFKTESRTIDVSNKIVYSPSANPFIQTIGSTQEFQSRVLGVAIATTTLSQGQFGQFPLYVFTEDGIWAMETAADGSLVTSKPLSRDVCVNPDSITSIDNAVVFVTDKGVMLLQGSQVVNISPNMNGRHYTIEETAKVIIEKTIEDTIAKIGKTPVDQMAQVIQNEVSQSISQQETRASIERTAQSIIAEEEFFKDLLPILSDSTHFMAFVREATIAYDYPGQRLVFIKKDEKYQYVYKLDTQTWHKTAYGIDLLAPINSYPECLVQGIREDSTLQMWVIENNSQEEWDYLADRIRVVLPDVKDEEIDLFLSGEGYLDVTEIEKEGNEEWLTNELDTYHVATDLKWVTKDATRIYDLSTILDAAESRIPTRGVIVTRPFDLGAPDVLKTITDIKIRGQYARGAVKFMLLGSMDGINFYVIGTKRGKAWKLFRLIILADLDPTERISWVDVIYDEKFTNRLR